MGWVFGILAATLAIVFIWGVFAPRSQWRALSAWSLSDEHAHEPGGTAYGWRRVISALGALGIGAVVAVSSSAAIADLPPSSTPTESVITQMWGSPNPLIVDRDITPVVETPPGLVEVPISGYQVFDDGLPLYLDGLNEFKYLGNLDFPGFVGSIPDVGFSALDFADLVVHVRGPILCVPRQVAVLESETDVKIAVYYGVPDPADGSIPDNTAACAVDSSVTSSVLIPINLAAPVGDRLVTTLNGDELTAVDVPETED